ncbi:SMI1/KNR4 family protein [Bacillus sp. WMMC1349]|uniref:SMI1/KNR4 family protein n=1 Tax=Bacillus sp. WMMC1349 TaxID=2736254 RepID=UPI0015579F0C|nr:SMI1/KNR4 family protein [Bacillus sp. WMMC1349]NPC93412.1 SMI1/KNR4 family protein [Bacillus sp. WMMC1349]
MKEGKLVKMTIACLKKTVSKYGTFPMLIQGGDVLEDPYFYFNDPATDKQIDDLEKALNVKLPKDYKVFLGLHNGIEFIDGIEVLSIKDVLTYNEIQDLPKGYILIGYHDAGHYIIDTNKYHKGLDYMYYKDGLDDMNEAEALGSSFEIWLDRILSANGNKYWESNQCMKKYYESIVEE